MDAKVSKHENNAIGYCWFGDYKNQSIEPQYFHWSLVSYEMNQLTMQVKLKLGRLQVKDHL